VLKNQILGYKKNRQDHLNLRFCEKIEFFYSNFQRFKNIKSFFIFCQFVNLSRAKKKISTNIQKDLLIFYKDFEYSRLIHLEKIIAIKKPKVIVEFGSGLSTFFLLKTVEKLGIETKIISYEQDGEYAKNTAEFLLDYDKKKRVELRLCDVDYFIFNDSRFIAYKDPDYPKKIDFLYIDGPVIYEKSHNSNLVMAGDIIRLIHNNIFPEFIALDKKYDLYFSTKKLCKKFYKTKFDFIYKSFTYEKK
jgi:hypothetical protein